MEILLLLIGYKYILKKIKYKNNHEETYFNFDHAFGTLIM